MSVHFTLTNSPGCAGCVFAEGLGCLCIKRLMPARLQNTSCLRYDNDGTNAIYVSDVPLPRLGELHTAYWAAYRKEDGARDRLSEFRRMLAREVR